jgi:hypothetical protein
VVRRAKKSAYMPTFVHVRQSFWHCAFWGSVLADVEGGGAVVGDDVVGALVVPDCVVGDLVEGDDVVGALVVGAEVGPTGAAVGALVLAVGRGVP